MQAVQQRDRIRLWSRREGVFQSLEDVIALGETEQFERDLRCIHTLERELPLNLEYSPS